MELLPKEIQLIVYRYLFDSSYQMVIRYYKTVFIEDDAYWNEEVQCLALKSRMIAVANWRPLSSDYFAATHCGYVVRSLHTQTPITNLPIRY